MKKFRGVAWSLIVLLVGIMFLSGCSSSQEETKTITVSSFGGDYELAQKELVKAFEKEHKVKVKFVTLYSNDALVRLRAEKSSPTLDVVQFSGGQEVTAAKENLLKKMDPKVITNQQDLHTLALNKQGYAPNIAFDAMGIIYNSDKIKTAPTSWNDLWKSDYKGHVGLADISNTFGLQFAIMSAKVNGGSENNIQPGFDKIKSLLPNVAAVVNTSPDVGNLFAQDEAWIAPYDSAYAFSFKKKGQPIRYVTPKEGAMATLINAQVVNGSKNEKLAQEFINYFLRADVQQKFAEQTGFAPSNKKVKLSAELAEVIPYGEEAVNKLIPTDWDAVNKNKSAWTEEWKKMISK